MLIAVLSDSHGYAGALSNVLLRMDARGKPDILIHLGDGARDALAFEPMFRQTYYLRGNCDFSELFPDTQVVYADDTPIYCEHGHISHVKSTLSYLLDNAASAGARAALFGHTHAPLCRYERGILLLNPGAAYEGHGALLRVENGNCSGELF